jgi:hypothetical protein
MQTHDQPTAACSAPEPNLPTNEVENLLGGPMIRDPSRASGTSMAICNGQQS